MSEHIRGEIWSSPSCPADGMLSSSGITYGVICSTPAGILTSRWIWDRSLDSYDTSKLLGLGISSRLPGLKSLRDSFSNSTVQVLMASLLFHSLPFTDLKAFCMCNAGGLYILKAFHVIISGCRCYWTGFVGYSPAWGSSSVDFLYSGHGKLSLGSINSLPNFSIEDTSMSCDPGPCSFGRMERSLLKCCHRGQSRKI